MSYELLRQGLVAPLCITWELTYACNLRCAHCLSSSGKRAPDEPGPEECRGILDDLAEMKVFYINVGGGEPLLRRDIFDIAEYSLERGIGFHVSTNGTLLSEKIVRRIAGLPGLRVQVSLDGVDEATNDAIRGQGSYHKAMQALALLRRHRIDFSINCVLTRFSFLQLGALYELARTYGARLRLSRLRPSGRGRERWDLLHPTREQSVRLYYWLREHPEVLTGDSFFFLSALGPQRDGLGMCGAGRVTCGITPTGDVYACPFLLSPQFRAGNVREQPLSVIWRDSLVFQQLRQYEVEACQSCLLFHSCHGGCIAASFYVAGALGNPDPECVAIASLNERTA
ncbi:MAG: mycofactocin radical SAM maturase [Dehalococcoidia bacterium]